MRKLLLTLLLLLPATCVLAADLPEPTYFTSGELKYQYFDGTDYYVGGTSTFENGQMIYFPKEGGCIVAANPDYTGTDLVIPETVFYNGQELKVLGIAAEAFKGNQTITSVTFPNTFPSRYGEKDYSVRYYDALLNLYRTQQFDRVGDNIFADCPKLSKVVFSEGMKYFLSGSINSGTPFANCPLSEVVIPPTLTDLNNLFIGSAVETIDIPATVTKISFKNCTKLTEIPDMPGLTEIPDNCFSYCTSLENVIIPDNITNIGQYAFSECSSLKSVVISDNVTYLSMCAFRNCKNLENVVIGSGVKQFATNVFEGSDAISEIEFKPTTPPTFYQIGAPTTKPEDAGIFDQTVLDNAVATVPEGTLANYRKQGWFKFAHAQDTTTGIEDITADITTAPEEYFNLQGMQVSADTLTPGIYIRRQGSRTSKIIVR